MKAKFLHEMRIGGLIAVLFGLVSLYEAKRMYAYSHDFVTGDHAFPGLIGILLLLFGGSLMFGKIKEDTQVEFPARRTAMVLVSLIILLFFYSLLINYAGYAVSTLIAAVGLIKMIGHYGWLFSIISGAVITAALYVVFIVLLKTPLSTGLFGI